MDGIWLAFLEAQIAKGTFILVLFHNERPISICFKDTDWANNHTLTAFVDSSAFVHVDFYIYEFAHAYPPKSGP